MLVLNRRKKLTLALETVYFADDPFKYETDVDIVLFYLSTRQVRNARVFHTLRIDLLKPEEQLFNELGSTTRNRIRRAEKSGEFSISFYDAPDQQVFDEFCKNYDEFANTKGIDVCDRTLMQMAREQKALRISMLTGMNGEILCGTAEIHDEEITLGMYSFSHFRRYKDSSVRSMISNANRYLYWELIKRDKQLGFVIMDMGGLGMGQETSNLDSVDEFKQGFGGEIRKLYHFYQARTLKGKLALLAIKKNRQIKY